MLVYKFGGSSLKNAGGIRNVSGIISKSKTDLVVVLSALGKTTNAMEELVRMAWEREDGIEKTVQQIRLFHFKVLDELIPRDRQKGRKALEAAFAEFEFILKVKPGNDYDRFYDQVVSHGEIWATIILEDFLKNEGVDLQLVDARKLIVTDGTFRNAQVDWEQTGTQIKKHLDFKKHRIFLTQGFIGGTTNHLTTTLGREGSDFTAAVFGNILNAEKVTIWKDVPGVLNADPKSMKNPVKLPEISYREAIELAYFGARVIHPKTIKPLQNKHIPLVVKSFFNPREEGTLVTSDPVLIKKIPSYIFKYDQLLFSISPKDFSFAIDQSLGDIFSILNTHKIKINLVQNSAISLSVCVDHDDQKLPGLLKNLQQHYQVYYNKGVELITIRHYSAEAFQKVLNGKVVLFEQKTRSTVHFVVKPGNNLL